jgi:Carboxypeptidase regulatory-like domain
MQKGVMVAFAGAFALWAASTGCGRSPASDDASTGDKLRWGTVTGRVEAGGEPVRRVLIEPLSLDDPAPPVPELAVFTDDTGRYEWRLPAGSYRLTTRAGRYHPSSGRVDVTGGGTAQLNFILQPRR